MLSKIHSWNLIKTMFLKIKFRWIFNTWISRLFRVQILWNSINIKLFQILIGFRISCNRGELLNLYLYKVLIICKFLEEWKNHKNHRWMYWFCLLKRVASLQLNFWREVGIFLASVILQTRLDKVILILWSLTKLRIYKSSNLCQHVIKSFLRTHKRAQLQF